MKNETAKKKKLPYILLAIILIIGAIAALICFNASKNMKAMNATVDAGMQALSESTEVTPLDAGEYEQIKIYGLMKFDVSQYDVKDIGNLSVMKVNMGFMQMVSFVITPYEKDMPLLSMDFMYILGNRKAYAEFYDLVKDISSPEYVKVLDEIRGFEERYSDMEDVETEPAWYDDLLTVVLHKADKRKNDDRVQEMFCDAVKTYMSSANELEKLDSSMESGRLMDTTGAINYRRQDIRDMLAAKLDAKQNAPTPKDTGKKKKGFFQGIWEGITGMFGGGKKEPEPVPDPGDLVQWAEPDKGESGEAVDKTRQTTAESAGKAIFQNGTGPERTQWKTGGIGQGEAAADLGDTIDKGVPAGAGGDVAIDLMNGEIDPADYIGNSAILRQTDELERQLKAIDDELEELDNPGGGGGGGGGDDGGSDEGDSQLISTVSLDDRQRAKYGDIRALGSGNTIARAEFGSGLGGTVSDVGYGHDETD